MKNLIIDAWANRSYGERHLVIDHREIKSKAMTILPDKVPVFNKDKEKTIQTFTSIPCRDGSYLLVPTWVIFKLEHEEIVMEELRIAA